MIEKYYEELMKLLYLIEDEIDYNETPSGFNLGKTINKLQKWHYNCGKEKEVIIDDKVKVTFFEDLNVFKEYLVDSEGTIKITYYKHIKEDLDLKSSYNYSKRNYILYG